MCCSICVLLSWREQATLHQLLCDMGLWGFHVRHVAGANVTTYSIDIVRACYICCVVTVC